MSGTVLTINDFSRESLVEINERNKKAQIDLSNKCRDQIIKCAHNILTLYGKGNLEVKSSVEQGKGKLSFSKIRKEFNQAWDLIDDYNLYDSNKMKSLKFETNYLIQKMHKEKRAEKITTGLIAFGAVASPAGAATANPLITTVGLASLLGGSLAKLYQKKTKVTPDLSNLQKLVSEALGENSAEYSVIPDFQVDYARIGRETAEAFRLEQNA